MMSERIDAIKTAMRKEWLFIVLFVLYLAWMLPGVFPLYCYEGDSLSIAWGCEQAMRYGLPLWDLDSYGYWMQPLIYYMICFLSKIFGGADCEAVYSAMTAVFALVMIVMLLIFAHKLSGISMAKLMIAMYLIPEVAALAFYPNSAVFVMVFFVGGLLLTLNKRVWAACVLFCIAPLFRLDILYIYPMIVLLNFHVFGLCRRSILVSLAEALLVAVITYVGYYLLHADILLTLSEFGHWSEIITWLKNALAIIGFYTALNFILIPAGLYLLYRNGKKFLFWMIVLALVIVHFVNRDFGNAAKHYCYLLPFVLIAIGAAIDKLWEIRHSRRWLTVGAICVIILFNVVSVSVIFDHDRPEEYKSLKAYRSVTDLLDMQILGHDVEIGIGGGMDYNTGDELMMLTGNAFYPSFIHKVRENDGYKDKVFRRFVEGLKKDVMICWTGYEDHERLRLIYNTLPSEQQSKVDLRSFCDNQQSYRNQAAHILACYKKELSAYAEQYPEKDIYVCTLQAICFRVGGMFKLMEQDGSLVEVEDGIYLYKEGR